MFTTSISLISFGIANKTKDNSEAEGTVPCQVDTLNNEN